MNSGSGEHPSVRVSKSAIGFAPLVQTQHRVGHRRLIAADDEVSHLLNQESGNGSNRTQSFYPNATSTVAIENLQGSNRQCVSFLKPCRMAQRAPAGELEKDVSVDIVLGAEGVEDLASGFGVTLAKGLEGRELLIEIVKEQRRVGNFFIGRTAHRPQRSATDNRRATLDAMAAAQLPYESLPDVPSLTVTSTDVSDGQSLPMPQVSGIFGAGGEDVSPQLSWSGFPAETKSFVVTCFDPDAPTGSGFWHWAVLDIPADVTELATNAGSQDGANLPAGTVVVNNDAGLPGYLGAAPPAGHGVHRYVFAVHALATEAVGVDNSVTNAIAGFNMFGKVIARGVLTPVYEQ